MDSFSVSRMVLKNHLGHDSAPLRKCVALVSSSHCDGGPGSRYMDPEYDLCIGGVP